MGTYEIDGGLPASIRPLVNLYTLRLIVKLGGFRQVMDERRVLEPELLAELGVECPEPELPHRPDLLLIRLRNRLKACERQNPALPDGHPLTGNLQWLTSTLKLNPVEADIVGFLALVHHVHLIREFLDKFQTLRIHEVFRVLATVLGHPVAGVSEALTHTAKLVKSGLVWVDFVEKWGFGQKVGLLDGVGDQLMLAHSDPFRMFLSNLRRSEPGSLQVHDFGHLGDDLQVLVPYLRDALTRRRKGVNILIVGPPGTGKTELTHAMAADLGAPLFEIAVEDRNGYPYSGQARFGAYQLAQGLLGGDPCPLVLLDEAEDVLRPKDDSQDGGIRRRGSGHKAWTNLQLQENPVPSVWVCNSTAGFEACVLRRFDFILKVDIPPRSVRLRMLEHHASDLGLSPSWLQEMAQHEHLSPAAIERAAKVTRVVQGAKSVLQTEDVMSRILGNAFEVMGIPRIPRDKVPSETPYRLDILNVDRDLSQIINGVKGAGSARIALWGPPGTGKTAFAHYLAKALDKPLIVKRASDVVSAWVGETEKALAAMFEEAAREGAVLLLDEADSFLADRRGAQRSWEVTQVNELLTQLESYRGVFIASTNRMEHMDEASLRRFDIKIYFDFLTVEQREAMFRDCLDTLGLNSTTEAIEAVSQLAHLTPGDFNTVMRQHRLDPISTAVVFADRLAQEVQMKPGSSRRLIGFK